MKSIANQVGIHTGFQMLNRIRQAAGLATAYDTVSQTSNIKNPLERSIPVSVDIPMIRSNSIMAAGLCIATMRDNP